MLLKIKYKKKKVEKMTIYLDIVLIENLCMNYIILFATGFIMKIKLHHIRIILSALVGGIYAILSYMEIFPFYSTMVVKIILSVCMVYIAFFPKGIKSLLKHLVMFYLVSFAFGGCAFALLYFIKPEDIFMINGVYVGTYPIKIALLGGVVGFVITYIAFKVVKSRMTKKSLIHDVEIKIEEKTIKIKALLDTGNGLKEPITGEPVIVVERDRLYGILPGNILNNIDKIIGGDWGNLEEDIEYRTRFRVIPFKSIGKQNGMLLGFRVDEVNVITDIDKIVNQKVIMCIYNGTLTRTNTYSALIGLDMLEGREKNEFIANIKI